MIVVSETGSAIMKMHEDFNKYAQDVLHITNPLYFQCRAPSEMIDISPNDTMRICIDKAREIDEQTRVSREEWIAARDRYVAERILRELGYEVLVTTQYREYYPDATPYEGATGQCSFDCLKYFNCAV